MFSKEVQEVGDTVYYGIVVVNSFYGLEYLVLTIVAKVI